MKILIADDEQIAGAATDGNEVLAFIKKTDVDEIYGRRGSYSRTRAPQKCVTHRAMDLTNHDPWNEPTHRHPRAQALMDEALWDCVNEHAPFGSDEGACAYDEYRTWRADHPDQDLERCLEWIGDESGYGDAFTFDATIVATVLSQLIDEGHIDESVKPAARAAIARQLESAEDDERRDLLGKSLRAIEQA